MACWVTTLIVAKLIDAVIKPNVILTIGLVFLVTYLFIHKLLKIKYFYPMLTYPLEIAIFLFNISSIYYIINKNFKNTM
ncbi:Uncharacterised protein [Staphylococcus warneri]|nr:Uncharacterised protein [Staphylococcus warneri]